MKTALTNASSPFPVSDVRSVPVAWDGGLVDAAARLVDEALPPIPVRQGVLSLPFEIRYRLAWIFTIDAIDHTQPGSLAHCREVARTRHDARIAEHSVRAEKIIAALSDLPHVQAQRHVEDNSLATVLC